MQLIWFWLFAIVLFIVLEAFSVSLVSIWMILGSIAALVCRMAFGVDLWVQIVVFIVVSVVSLLIGRKPLMVAMKKGADNSKTNMDRIFEHTGIVDEEINNLENTGAVRIGGQVWTARTFSDNEIIPRGSKIKPLEVQGVKLIVKGINNNVEA